MPLAVQFNSQNYAVMMGTPADFEDFAMGFAIAEGIIAKASDVTAVLVLPTEQGYAIDLSVPEEKINRDRMAKRSLEGRTGCGLCGIEDMKDAIRMPQSTLPAVELRPQAVARAYDELPAHQPMSRVNRTVHAAAWCSVDGEILPEPRGRRPPQCARQADRRAGPRRRRPLERLRADVQPLQLRARPEMRHRRHRRAGHRFRPHRARAFAGAAGASQTGRARKPRRHDLRQGLNMQHQDMLRMANQIASFFNGSGPEAAVKDAAEHINKFWDPRMRAVLIAHLDKGGEGLDETIVKAASLIRRPNPANA